MAIDEVARLRKDAEDLRQALASQEFPDEDIVRALRDQIGQHAMDLISLASEPVTIGVVGAFSVGKSMLIGTLLGRPDLLPTEQRATTGNVTALYLEPGEPGEPTQFDGDARVSYMSPQELTACVRYMLDELTRHVTKVTPNADVSALVDYDPVTQDWRRLEQWCRSQLWATEFGNPEQRKIAVELATIRDAHLSAGHLLGQRVTVTERLIRDVLDLGKGHPVPGAFPERNMTPAITEDSVARDSTHLRATFPLIKRVAYRVKVNPGIWSVAKLQGDNAIVLLDFPGLTARRSALRDEYLSRAELRDIHTIITVISATDPETDVPDRFYSMLERAGSDDIGRDHLELRESILVVGNRFDLIAPPAPNPAGPLGIADLRALSQHLNGLCTTAPDLVQHQEERIRLTSSTVAIGLSRQDANAGLPADFHGEEGDKVAAAIPASLERSAAWRAIAARMTATDPADPWGPTLTAFAADGGMASLRDLIETHAVTHGLSNKLSAMRRQHARMLAELPRLGRLAGPRDPSASADAAARELVSELFADIRKHYTQVYETLSQLRDPTTLKLADNSDVLAAVRRRAVTEVMRWQEWQTILSRSNGGYIFKPKASVPQQADGELDSFLNEVLGTQPVGDETTQTFLPMYRDSLRAAVTSGREGLEKAVVNWIETQNDRAAELVRRMAEPKMRELLDGGLPRISTSHGGADVGRVLELITDLSWLRQGISAILAASFGDGEAERSYPLYIDRAMPWHSQVPEPGDDVQQQLARHQFYVFRLQRQLANGISDAVAGRLAKDLDQIHGRLQYSLQRLTRGIPDSADLRAMFPDDPPSQDGADPPRGNDGPRADSPLLDYLSERMGR
jgi:hypothetical protein